MNDDKITSPEQMNNLMKITKARMWILLIILVLILSGCVVFILTATVEKKLVLFCKIQRYSTSAESIPIDISDTLNFDGVMDAYDFNEIISMETLGKQIAAPASATFFLNVQSNKKNPIKESMKIVVDDKYEGQVSVCSQEVSWSYEEIKNMFGVSDSELTAMGIFPEQNYIFVFAGVSIDDDDPGLIDGTFHKCKVILDSVNLSKLMK